jgi:hypothetical protein
LAFCASAAQAWDIRYSSGVRLHAPAREFSFDFPRAPGSVHYITKPATIAAKGAVQASFSITTRGDAVFDYHTAANNTCNAPAAVRLLLQRKADNLSGAGPYAFYRWWSIAGTVLRAGSFTLTVPLKPALWSSVFGKTGDANPRAFADALADLGNVGVTFGGGCFYGHGVRLLRGSAVFTMKRFAIR